MSRTLTWTLSLLAGFVTLVLLGAHMGFIAVNYILLVGVALFHGFYGLHTILTEIWSSRRAGAVSAGICAGIGGGLFALTVLTALVT